MKRMTTLCLVLICAFFLAACGGGVDQASYDKIENGMTLDEVKGILGEPTEGGGAGALGNSSRGVQLAAVALAIVEAQGMAGQALVAGDGEHGRRVEPAGDEDDGVTHRCPCPPW